MHVFVGFSQTLSSRHIKMKINLTFLKDIFIINYCLETAVFKFNCLVPLYKSLVSCCMRGINERYESGLVLHELNVKENMIFYHLVILQ